MTQERISSPTGFLSEMLGDSADLDRLAGLESWWKNTGKAISASVDRCRTPWLRMFDVQGTRVDEILYPPEYAAMLTKGYEAGAVWRIFEQRSLIPFFLTGYVTSFFDAGLYCPYTVTAATAAAVDKYGTADLKERYLPRLLSRGGDNWQGATWMTEAGGGSDLGANVRTIARRSFDGWKLTGSKYFASNAGAELALVGARLEDAPPDAGVKGLALFLVPRRNGSAAPNYFVTRLKDKLGTRSVPTAEVELRGSEAFLLGRHEHGIHLIMEVLNLSRVANAVGSVALAHRALCNAREFASQRIAFGLPVAQQPMLAAQLVRVESDLINAFSLAWAAVRLLDEVWRECPPYSPRYDLFRLTAHLAKYWCADVAVRTARWSMEVHGGAGVLEEHEVERWLREAMILSIWEGTPHRQMLDALSLCRRRSAHKQLFAHLDALAAGRPATDESRRRTPSTSAPLAVLEAAIDDLLTLPIPDQEARWEPLFLRLAETTASPAVR